MRQAGRFPIKEALLSAPQNYWLYMDSIMKRMWELHLLEESSERNIEQKAPANSEVSDEELSLGEFSSSSSLNSDEQEKPKVVAIVESSGKSKLDKSLLSTQGFNIAQMGNFPFVKLRDGEIPKKLLIIPEIESMPKTSKALKM